MMSNPAASEQQEPLSQAMIVDVAKSCLESFQQCLNSASKADKVISSLVSKLSLVRVEDQLARFSLWTANLRVFSINRDSLDSRLREAPDVKDAIIGLLQALDYHAKTCDRVLASFSSRSNEKPAEESLQRFDNALDELRNDITLLHKISNTIRRASKETQNIKAAEVFKIEDDEGNDAEPFLRQLFIIYVRDRFPGTTEDIRERLVDSMVLRRKRILYRKKRYGKTSIRLPETVAKPVISHPRPDARGEATQGPVKRRAVEAPQQSHIQSVTKTATTLSPEKFKKAAAPSVISMSKTVAISSSDELRFPPPPTAGLMRKYNKAKREIEKENDELKHPTLDYEESRKRDEQLALKREKELTEAWKSCIEAVAEVTCPYCFHVLPIREVLNEKKWKLHVKNDLDPYVCLFENCDSPNQLYSHSGAWIKHMKEHTRRWRCKSKAHGEFIAESRTDYVEHMKTSHPGKFTDAQLSVLADRNAHTGAALFTTCPLCGIEKTDTPMESHVVSHMRLLALKSLPATPEDVDELEGSEGDHDSLDASQPHTRSTMKDARQGSSFWNVESYYDGPESDGVPVHPFGKRSSSASESSISASGDLDADDDQPSTKLAPSSEFEEIRWDFIPCMQESDQDQQHDPILQSFVQRGLHHQTSPKDPGPPTRFRIDPDCAICRAPASEACNCEAKALDVAVKQAESRMMGGVAKQLRHWVQAKAQGYMDRKPTQGQATLNKLDSSDSNPSHQDAAKEIDEDEEPVHEGLNQVRQCDVDFPEVLDYYFSLVEVSFPAEDHPSVKDPPLGQVGSYKGKDSDPLRNPSYRNRRKRRGLDHDDDSRGIFDEPEIDINDMFT